MHVINKEAVKPEEKVSVAAGMAVFKAKEDSGYQSVFKRADEKMYANKERIKAGEEPIIDAEKLEL